MTADVDWDVKHQFKNRCLSHLLTSFNPEIKTALIGLFVRVKTFKFIFY